MMEQRVVIFLVLSLAVILGYDFLLKQFGLLPATPTTDQTVQETSTVNDLPAGGRDRDDHHPQTSSQVSSVRPDEERPSVSPGRSADNVTIDTELIRAELNPRGGTIVGWKLKRYQVAVSDPQPVQLVYQGAKFRQPLSLTMSDQAVQQALQEGLFSIEADTTKLDSAHPVGRVRMVYRDEGSGVQVRKELVFHHDSYVVDVTVSVEGGSKIASYNVGLGTNFGIVEWGDGLIGQIGSASMVDGNLEKETPESESERKGTVQWLALQDKYFMAVLLPTTGSVAQVKKEGDKLLSASVQVPSTVQPAAMRLYAGPKEYDTLRSLNVGLEDTIDFGWFIFGSWSLVKAVAKPIFYVLRVINEYTHNYGITIILLTVIIKLLFAPLQYKSYKSMKQMQMIQPKVAALQEKFKEDRDRLNKELIKLYRDHRVNPVGGCLPMVLQMPVFVALFNILYMTIDLRQAPFLLWIQDLSVQDPYYVLPIVMGASMVVMQKIQPTTMDPTQAKIMLVMPVMMTFLFINFAAGLVLYWLTNNVLSVGQQLLTDRLFLGRWNLPALQDAGSPSVEKRNEAGKGRKE